MPFDDLTGSKNALFRPEQGIDGCMGAVAGRYSFSYTFTTNT